VDFLKLKELLSGLVLGLFALNLMMPTTASGLTPKIPQPPYVPYVFKKGETVPSIASKFGVSTTKLVSFNKQVYVPLIPGKRIYIPSAKDYLINKNHIVSQGDNLWKLGIRYAVPMYELMQVNNLNLSSNLSLGQVVKVPQHYIAARPYRTLRSGQPMDWFKQAQYAFPISAKAIVKDVKTGRTFKIKRTYGASHADVETLTAQDTAIMKSIFGGKWTWTKRPVLIYLNGYRIAASAAGMPHAGIDGAKADITVANRSDHYGTGPNLDQIKNNNMNGHFDIHFLNSRRHNNDQIDPVHQSAIQKAAYIR
jgi:LysM repeat protein